MRGLFVTGTDTGVGKTVVAAAIAAALRARGERVAAVKPVVTGLDEAGEPGAPPPDHELLAAAAGVASARGRRQLTFGPPLSPHLRRTARGRRDRAGGARRGSTRARRAMPSVLVAEGVGGLLVPLTPGYLIRDYALELGLPLVVAARPGLGTINHTLLTLEAARAAGLDVAGVVLTPWPAAPGEPLESNRATIAALGRVDVATLAHTALDAGALARAGARLPLERWLS